MGDQPFHPPAGAIDLYWLPLGAGGHLVAFNGRVYEALAAWRARRPRSALYHSALEVRMGGRRCVIEMAPIFAAPPESCGVVAQGCVGSRRAGRFVAFRYGIRRWWEGQIPDVAFAVGGPRHVSTDPACARRLLDIVPTVPTPVWGRDELGVGEGWNSNSVVAWLLERAGVDTAAIAPPDGGRAPGWDAGVAVARDRPIRLPANGRDRRAHRAHPHRVLPR